MSDNLEYDGIISCLARTPVELTALLVDIPESALHVRLSEDEFSAVENICHLRDIEIEGYAIRIRRILSEDCPTLPDIDGGKLAFERDYNKQDLSEALAAYELARSENLLLLRNATQQDLFRTAVMSGLGEITLKGLLQMMQEHDEGHLDDVRRIRNQWTMKRLHKSGNVPA